MWALYFPLNTNVNQLSLDVVYHTLHMSLDVISFYDRLEHRYGPDAVRLKPDSSTAAIKMIGVDGLPINAGWFQNRSIVGAPLGAPDAYAITSIPDYAKHANHRIMLEQPPTLDDLAILNEEDCDGYLEGYDDYPTVISRRTLGQPVLASLITEVTDHALVLDAGGAEEYARLSRDLALDGLRDYGMTLRETRAGLGYVTFD